MALRIGDKAPNFKAQTTVGEIDFHQWMGDHWVLLFSHPADFTPVCTSELGYLANMVGEFDRRGVKLLGLSVDTLANHRRWLKDIEATHGVKLGFPVVADPDRIVVNKYDLLSGNGNLMTTGRSAIVIDPTHRVRLMTVYPESTGRNFHEILRTIDALQLTTDYEVLTPVNWQRGEDVFISPTLSDSEAKNRFPAGWKELNHYLRMVPDPAP